MSLKKNLLKNGLASSLLKGIKIAEQLLLVPFFISAWGPAYYGEWLTLTIIPTIIGLSDMGFGTAAANTFVLKYAAGDKQGASNIYKSGMFTLHLIILLSVIISSLVILVCNFYHIFDKSLIVKTDAIIAISLLMFSRIITFYKQLFDAYFKAARRFNISINLQTIYSLVVLISSILVLIFKGGVVLFSLMNFLFAIIYVLVHMLIAKRTLQINRKYKGIIQKTEIQALFKKGFGFLLAPIWQAVFFQGTTFVVRFVLGPIAVTIFNTVRTLTRAVFQANSLVVSSVIPELQYEMGSGQYERARKLFRFSLLLICSISILGMLFLLTGGSWFYEIWTRKALSPPNIMWYVFILGIFFNAIWTISSEVILAANKPYVFTIIGTITAIVSVLISYILSLNFGLSGAAVGSLFMDVLLVIYILPHSCKLLQQPINELLSNIITDIKFIVLKRKFNKFFFGYKNLR